MKRGTLLLLLPIFILTSCAEKEFFDQSDQFWYKEIISALSRNDLDQADTSYISLQSEHSRSPMLSEATLLMIQAYINREEYLLAEFYIDRYLQQFGNSKNREYIEFLRIKSKYLSFQNPRRDQKLIHKTLHSIERFKELYSSSNYLPYIESMRTDLQLSIESLNSEIISLYERLEKPKAVQIYKDKSDSSWYEKKDVAEPEVFWLKKLFE